MVILVLSYTQAHSVNVDVCVYVCVWTCYVLSLSCHVFRKPLFLRCYIHFTILIQLCWVRAQLLYNTHNSCCFCCDISDFYFGGVHFSGHVKIHISKWIKRTVIEKCLCSKCVLLHQFIYFLLVQLVLFSFFFGAYHRCICTQTNAQFLVGARACERQMTEEGIQTALTVNVRAIQVNTRGMKRPHYAP